MFFGLDRVAMKRKRVPQKAEPFTFSYQKIRLFTKFY
jgi:hypothetical protein